jgi:glycosyltransferase involved in cell wall biosynthesis
VTGEPAGRSLAIVHVVVPAAFGGLESVVVSLARGQAAAGHRVHVLSVFDAEAVRRPLGEGVPGVVTHAVVVPERRYWREFEAVRATLRSVDADVVHTHGYRPDVIAGLAAWQLGLPKVTTVHGFSGGGLKNRFFEWLQVQAMKRADAVVAVSRPLVERLRRAGVPLATTHCIRNAWVPVDEPVDRETARRTLGLPHGVPVLGWVGRLWREKGPDVLLRALALLGPDGPLAAVVGDGPQAGELRALAASLGVERLVRWCGTVPGASTLYRAFDAYVLSSRTEGTPLVLFEAMAAGVPIVAARVGGVPDVVSSEGALLVPPEDPAALAEAIRTSLARPDEAAARVRVARARLASEFGAERWYREHEELYRAVVRPLPDLA